MLSASSTLVVSCLGLSLCLSNATAASETTLYDFCSAYHCEDGILPLGVTLDPNSGNLFGVAHFGGNKYGGADYGCTLTNCDGVVFEYSPSTATYTVLHKFCKPTGCADGRNPSSVPLVIDTAGNIYGTTEYGGNTSQGGVAFELMPGKAGWHEKVLYTFCSRSHCKDGADPRGGLTYIGAVSGQAYDGTSPLYGTTFKGGANGRGTVYAVTPKSGTKKWSEQVLYSFCTQANCTDGWEPNAGLTVDAAGNVFGAATQGGQFGGGAIFEVGPNNGSYVETVLYSFCAQTNCTDGEGAWGGVILDESGNLFGTTDEGGSTNDGVLFELTPDGSQWQYEVLVNFDGANGANSSGPLIPDGAGGVYGTTAGFTDGTGATVFDFNGGSLQSLYTFCSQKGCPDGRFPMSNLVLDASGNLFGTASFGAKRDSGTLFELMPSRRAVRPQFDGSSPDRSPKHQ